MDRSSEYNVVKSFLGLGPDILLELLSEMILPQDVRQFLVLCKQIYKLKDHPRFEKIIQSIVKITPFFIINDSSYGRSEVNKFIHSQEDNHCTIAIDPAISEGIVRFEVVFENTKNYKSLEICDSSCSFAANSNGDLNHVTQGIIKNQRYKDGQRIGIEIDMTTIPRRATFFVGDVQQPNYIIGIPSEIRFQAYTYSGSSSFTVTKFERLIKSSSQGVVGSKALQWGKEWN
ncbi:MAG: hypothetical protein EZS28_009388 [Streblomastix strix]|uniref:Uncharacterized protein n=1 Tax=Streblomastix strix TaxID=222440 RepID=A0A5J4WL42_9EUKA|nr:MAG: hypothetical protein EZS28_009388 [Streblomastix strix]